MDDSHPARAPKKVRECQGVLLFEDEASFWLDGTLHQTWSRVGIQPRVPTFGQRKTAHIFGAIEVESGRLHYAFAPVFNGHTFHLFLQQLVAFHDGRKVFVVMDNGACHWLDEEGKAWLAANTDKIELHRLPPYSPEFNPQEGVWKETRKEVTHNRFYPTVEARDRALVKAFTKFQDDPSILAPQVMRFRENASN